MQKLDNYSKTRPYGFDFVDVRPEAESTESLFYELLQESSVPIGPRQVLIDGRNYRPHEQLTQSVNLIVLSRTKRSL